MSYLFKSRSEQTPLTPASSEEQLAKINEVRELLCNLPMEMPKFLSDATIRRFLRARNWSTVQAAKSLKEAASWRRQYKPEKICWENITDSKNEARRAYIPDYLDKSGRMVFITLPTIKTKTSERDHIKYLVYNLENLVLNSEGAQEESVVWMSDFRSTPFSLTQESLHIIQKYYPGLIAVAILTNPPRIFESFWKIVKHFLEPKMNKKVKFVYNNNSESLRIMGDMFDLDKLESTFGGRNTAGLDINKYAEKMRRRDQMRGAWTQANGNTCSS
ncbi:phosphatidylinositol transfer protein 3-like isoform X2 [Panicum hallii]|uniref:phosphatidylinositol transfer protein 3-like isoform X2 n=1 Tax=Panicum hallii TaxID=206008 RepID=UPI000DF4E08A|nr:phosphatidylinositol transfer protein 3-like isoform X2 [Panicum hallii]